MNWQEVVAHPDLQNLPFKIELNERGQVVMSPTKIIHAIYQGEVIVQLKALMKGGRVLPECAIETDKGTKVADVVWVSAARLKQIKNEVSASIAPEICIEVVSGSNTKAEMDEKRTLYLAQGAKEVWFCNRVGTITFYNADGKLKTSELCPNFPDKLKI